MSPNPPAPPRRESLLASLRGAWRTLKADPIGLLLPSAGILLLGVATMVVLGRAQEVLPWPWEAPDSWTRLVILAATLNLLRFLLATPLRAAVLAAGAGALGLPGSAWRAIPALWIVDGAIGLGQGVAWCAIALPGVLITGAFVGHHAVTVGAVVLALALVAAAVAAFGVRVLLAYAPIEVVVGGRGPFAALSVGWSAGRGDRLQLAVLLLAGDTLTAVGGLFCGAGALPGHPFGPLAVLHRWSSSREVS